MKSLNEFVESKLDFESAECEFINELCTMLNLDISHIKGITVKNVARRTKVVQVISIELTGTNKFSAEDVFQVKGMSIITPNTIEIEVGEIHL